MSSRPDQQTARWRDEGVEEAGGAPSRPSAPSQPSAPTQPSAPNQPSSLSQPSATGTPSPVAGGTVDGGQDAGSEVDAGSDTQSDGGPILTDVAALSAQRDEYLESLQRLKADFDNYRKRVARLQQEQSARAEANLVTKLLPVLDNLDLAWAHLGPREGDEGPGSEEARAIGQARGQLLDVLSKEGLERLDAVGVEFDPTVHDAVAHSEGPEAAGDGAGHVAGEVPGEEPGEDRAAPAADAGGDFATDGAVTHVVSVDEVLRAGYRWRGQVLRPAMVRVRG